MADLAQESARIDKLISDLMSQTEKDLKDLDTMQLRTEADAKDAKAQGDLSENAEYQAALDRLKMMPYSRKALYARIKAYNAWNNEYVPGGGAVAIGSTIRLFIKERNEEHVVKVVPKNIGEPSTGTLSEDNPIIQKILGLGANDEVTVRTLLGELTYVIKEVY